MDGSISVLPVEVNKIIMSALDDRSSRMMRSTSSYWFNIVKYDYYEFYFVTPAILTDLVQKFSGYNKPFGLCLKKTKSPDETFTILASLTNLTRLEIEPLKRKKDLSPDLAFRFSTLTNLQSFAFYTSNITSHLRSFQNLTYFQHFKTAKNKPLNLADLKYLTKLQKVGIEMPVLTDKYDITSQFGNLSALKSIEFIDEDQNWNFTTFDPELVSKMSQVSYLLFASRAFFPFSKLPNLEYLYLNGYQFDSITALTKLTSLTMYVSIGHVSAHLERLENNANTYDYQQLVVLTNLRYLVLQVPLIDEQLSFLTALTNLEYLSVSQHDVPITGRCLQFVNSSKLTKLKVPLLDDIAYVSHLTNLQYLNTGHIKPESVSTATFELKSVTTVAMQSLTAAKVFPNMKRLNILFSGQQLSEDSWKLLALTKLNYLSLPLITDETLQMVSTMSNLTHFSARLGYQLQYDYEVLNHLTALKVLKLSETTGRTIPSDKLWQAIGKMTDLEILSLFHMNRHCVSTLEKLPKLKSLEVWSRELTGFNEKALSRLTNLQRLHLSDCTFARNHKCQLNFLPYLYSCTK